MKKYDLSDRKLKIAIILAMAMIAWLCLKGASASDGQSTPANFSSCRQIVRHLYVGVYPRMNIRRDGHCHIYASARGVESARSGQTYLNSCKPLKINNSMFGRTSISCFRAARASHGSLSFSDGGSRPAPGFMAPKPPCHPRNWSGMASSCVARAWAPLLPATATTAAAS
jgi:hypothetical protein